MMSQAVREPPFRSSFSQVERLSSLFAEWRQRVWSRYQLEHLSERDLADMGLTRQDVFDEAQKPFWHE